MASAYKRPAGGTEGRTAIERALAEQRSLLSHADAVRMADATGMDGEGLQVGEGDIDFRSLYRNLDRVAPLASFLPEIWQGHENDGAGFWIALDRLQRSAG